MACRMLLALPHVFLRQKSSVNQSRMTASGYYGKSDLFCLLNSYE